MVVICFSLCVASCDGRNFGATGTGGATDNDASAPNGHGGAGGVAGGGSGGGSGGAGGATYHGFVLAKALQGDSADTFRAFADFAVGGVPFGLTDGVGEQPTAGGCACIRGIATPDLFHMPDAGPITITGPADGVLARLGPSPVIFDGGTSSSSLQGTDDLGAGWYVFPADYAYVDASPWSAGDTLDVTAAGASVTAFTGTLHAGSRLSGVSPSLGAGPLIIPHDHDFEVSWAPDSVTGETVLVGLRQVALDSLVDCFCAAPDEAGSLTMPAGLLALYTADPQSCILQIERLNVSTVASGNGMVQLIGAFAAAAAATVQ